MKYYKLYEASEEVILPKLKKGDSLTPEEVRFEEKETQPPPRYNPASIVKEMETKNLGTKCIAGFESLTVYNDGHPKITSIGEFVESIGRGEQLNMFKTDTLKRGDVVQSDIRLVSSRPLENSERMLGIKTDYFSLCVTEDHDVFVHDPTNGQICNKKAKTLSRGDFLVSKMSRMCDSYSRLLGHLIGDCSFSIRKDTRMRDAVDIRYHNTEPALVKEVDETIFAHFGVKCKISNGGRGRYYLRLPVSLGRILFNRHPEIKRKYVPLGVIPDVASFCGALIDDEGCVFTQKREVRKYTYGIVIAHGIPKIKVTMKTRKSLQILQNALEKIGIHSTIYKDTRLYKGEPYLCYSLYIRGRRNLERLALNVSLLHPNKLQRLLQGLSRYKRVRAKSRILSLLDTTWKATTELARSCRYSTTNIRDILNELVQDGVVKRRRRTIRNRWDTNNTTILEYSLLIPFVDTFYAHPKDKIITYQLFAKRVHAVSQVKYADKVYDLSINPQNPVYFVGRGSFLVHNSTRAPILQTLYERGYVFGNQIEVSDLGMEVVNSLSKYCPEIVSEELTAHFEQEMEAIQERKRSKDEVINKARETLDELLKKFKEKQLDIGKELGEAYKETKRKQRVLGTCAKCGGELIVIVSRATHKRFAGCSNYPNCRNSFPLPQMGFIVSLDKKCDTCGAPMIQVSRPGVRPYRMCLEPKCSTKAEWGRRKTLRKRETDEEEE